MTNSLATQRFPNLPVAMNHGAGAQVGNVIYAGLGTAGTHWYALDLTAPHLQWAQMASFPGAPREQARAAAIGEQIYLFGGVGKPDAQAASVHVFDEVYRYDTAANSWHKQATRSPLGVLGSALWSPDGRQILSFGGANKAILDGFFADMAAGDEAAQVQITEAYFDRRPQDYLFTSNVLSYVPESNSWMNLGQLPFPATVGAAVAVNAAGLLTLVNGELKPGLRSPAVQAGSFDGAEMHWRAMPDLVGLGALPQEGLAGAAAGYLGDHLLVAGGTNFPGSWAAFNAGSNWAHRGLTKTWHDTIYALTDGQWTVVGKLPQAVANSLAFTLDSAVLLVGGELQQGVATDAVVLVEFDGVTASAA